MVRRLLSSSRASSNTTLLRFNLQWGIPSRLKLRISSHRLLLPRLPRLLRDSESDLLPRRPTSSQLMLRSRSNSNNRLRCRPRPNPSRLSHLLRLAHLPQFTQAALRDPLPLLPRPPPPRRPRMTMRARPRTRLRRRRAGPILRGPRLRNTALSRCGMLVTAGPRLPRLVFAANDWHGGVDPVMLTSFFTRHSLPVLRAV